MTKLSFRDFLLSHQIDIKHFRENCADNTSSWGEHTSYEELLQSIDYPCEIIDAAFNWSQAQYQPTGISWSGLQAKWEEVLEEYENEIIEYEVDWKLHLSQIFTKAPNAN